MSNSIQRQQSNNSYKSFFRNASESAPIRRLRGEAIKNGVADNINLEQKYVTFDEGPRITTKIRSVSNTGSIETRTIDPYRQGVSITRLKHFDAGLYKIHSGEPGHQLMKTNFGIDKNYDLTPAFQEKDYFEPKFFIQAQEQSDPLYFSLITFPIITGDNDQIENFLLNGIIEPFPIREIASFFSIEAPFQSRGVKGSLLCGNINTNGACEQILTVDNFDSKNESAAFLDLIQMFGSYSTVGFFRNETNTIKPFTDDVTNSHILSSQLDDEIKLILNSMTGSTDNYIKSNQKSAPAGWVFENTVLGTDSIAFGGQLH